VTGRETAGHPAAHRFPERTGEGGACLGAGGACQGQEGVGRDEQAGRGPLEVDEATGQVERDGFRRIEGEVGHHRLVV
jgi:hypothetical protein